MVTYNDNVDHLLERECTGPIRQKVQYSNKLRTINLVNHLKTLAIQVCTFVGCCTQPGGDFISIVAAGDGLELTSGEVESSISISCHPGMQGGGHQTTSRS